jgi:predicted adenylyl cyclase CyaB
VGKEEKGETVSTETETKIPVDNLDMVRQKILEFGGKPREEGEGLLCERNTFLDTPDGRLSQSDQLLRVREVRKDGWIGELLGASVTWKGPRETREDVFKARPELEIEILDAETAIKLLRALGFDFVVEVFEKQTEHFELEGVKIDLNIIPFLGGFAEFEGSKEVIEEVVGKLGLSIAQATPERYEELLEAHCQREGLPFDLKNFTFSAVEKLERI